MQQNLRNSSQEENQYLSSLQMRRELNTNLLMFPSRNGVATARAAGRDVMPIDKKTRGMILKVRTQSLPLFQTFSFTLNPVFHVVFACAKLTGSVSLTKAQVVRKRKCVGALFAHPVLVAELVI